MTALCPAERHPLDDIIRADRLPHIWCPGCGIGIAMRCYAQAILDSGIPLDQHSDLTRTSIEMSLRGDPLDSGAMKAELLAAADELVFDFSGFELTGTHVARTYKVYQEARINNNNRRPQHQHQTKPFD